MDVGLEWLTAVVSLGTSLLTSVHLVLRQRQSHVAVAWLLVVWFIPIIGAVAYLLFGINRITRRLRKLRQKRWDDDVTTSAAHAGLATNLENRSAHLLPLASLVTRVTQEPLTSGNKVAVLSLGEEAYPAMLDAIDNAQKSITLCTFIFDRDRVGARFQTALAAARDRGVEVRVLIDALGAYYSWPRPVTRALRAKGIPTALFLPTLWSWRFPYANLRNHRKILVVDGKVGFTGGMNIREGHVLSDTRKPPISDLHFQCEGPVVQQLQQVFAEDWAFTTGEILEGTDWFPELEAKGEVFARGISDGPDEDLDKLPWALRGAIDSAKDHIQIMTPYFLPEPSLMTALGSAALRGITVDIVLPLKGNLTIVRWAAPRFYQEALQYGCRLWCTPPPFDHSKLMVVDGEWITFGSANWDPRSLRLNFEFNVEAYDNNLGGELSALIESRRKTAQQLTLESFDNRPLALRLRDGVAKLFAANL